ALSVGEPAGIGPDLAVMVAQRAPEAEIVAFADPEVLRERARLLGLPLRLRNWDSSATPRPEAPGHLAVAPVPLAHSATPGKLDAGNSSALLEALDRAWAACGQGECAGIVTAPLHKGIINDA